MSEKLCSADAIEMGIDKYMVGSLCRLVKDALSMSLVSNSFSCMDVSTLGCKELAIRFLSVLRSEVIMAAFSNFVPSNDLAGKSLPNCPMRV